MLCLHSLEGEKVYVKSEEIVAIILLPAMKSEFTGNEFPKRTRVDYRPSHSVIVVETPEVIRSMM